MTDTAANDMPSTDMHCDEFVELVTAYLDGALDPVDLDRMMAHLSLCDGCSQYLQQFRSTIDLLVELPAAPIDPQLRSALVAAFRDRSEIDPGSA
jgi:anti-sigma factor RsiW